MQLTRYNVPLVTAADGTVTAFTPVVSGRVLSVVYTVDASTPMPNTTDIVVSTEDSGHAIVTLTNIAATKAVHPRVVTQDLNGADTVATEALVVCNERIKIAVAQGGNTLKGVVAIIVG